MKRSTTLRIALVSLGIAAGCTQTRETAPPAQAPAAITAEVRAAQSQTLTVCSFNIQFLGASKVRKDAALVDIVRAYDVVVVQELVAPPYAMQFPDGTPVKPDPESRRFFDRMQAAGFQYVLSEEDTGTGDKIHSNASNTEWFVTFYKPQSVQPASDLPNGFLADDRSNHPDYERVPCAFAFRTPGATLDFVLISVHLQPDAGAAPQARRQHELACINRWVRDHDQSEKDFIILGDMNIEDASELAQSTPAGFVSLNAECLPTNTSAATGKGKPYDHVMYQPSYTSEIDTVFGFAVIDLIEAVRPSWPAAEGPFPGDPYDHNRFRQYYSDHDPVVFRMIVPAADDDPNG